MSKSFQYGGQAVIEGVMMRGPKDMAVAVRKASGDIVVSNQRLKPLAEKYKFLKLPLLRGVVALFESLVLGIKILTYSANLVAEEEEEEVLTGKEIFFTVVLAIGLAVLMFIVIPTTLAHFLKAYAPSYLQNIIEGLLRMAIFVGYVAGIGRMKDIQRVFQYHGAEHKVINAYEAGENLTVDAVRKHTTRHPRCGTSFMLFVLVLTVFLYSFLHTPDILSRLVSRILLLPLVAGIAYELIKWSGKHAANPIVKLLIAPGLWMQSLTTREPDDSQIEVAICALESVLE
ncbi:MAG: DUF1385 domain-containing protein [Zhaonellaceae bacterium]|jgi:uncharacterized protein YqhQ